MSHMYRSDTATAYRDEEGSTSETSNRDPAVCIRSKGKFKEIWESSVPRDMRIIIPRKWGCDAVEYEEYSSGRKG